MKKFIKSTSILMIGDFLTKIISVLYLVPLKQIDNKIVLLMTNLLIPFGFFIVLTTMGVNIVLTSELVKAKNKKKIKSILLSSASLMAILVFISCALMTIFAPNIMGAIELNTDYVQVLVYACYVLNIGIVLFAINAYIRAIFTATGDYKIISITYISEQLIRVGIMLIASYYMFVIHDFNIIYSIHILVVSMIVSILSTSVIFLYYFLKKKYFEYFKGEYEIQSSLLRILLISSVIFFISGLYASLFDQIDLLFISNNLLDKGFSMIDIESIKTEYFTYSLKIVMIPITISTAFISVMIKHIEDEKTSKSKEIKKIILVALLYSFIMLLGIFIFGDLGYFILYREGTTILKIQALIIPFYIIKNIISGYIITNNGKKLSVVFSSIIIIATKIILDILLFNKFLYYGYIYASIAALFLGILVLVLWNWNLFSDKEKNGI